MSCPLELPATEVETWFINLWNHFVIPYLMGTIIAGIEVCVCGWVCVCIGRGEWIDVREWVVETYPWQPSVNVVKLRTLNHEDVGWNHVEYIARYPRIHWMTLSLSCLTAVCPQQNRVMFIKVRSKETE